jgi:hypothetical protein
VANHDDLLYSLERLSGVWATNVDVYRTRTDFTLDFLRSDPRSPSRAVLVARVAVAAETAGDLVRDLEARWIEYERGILPPEIFGEET